MDSGGIELATMRQLTEARNENDDWTGTTTKAERRRRQNRLNQRAARKRKAERAATAKEKTTNQQLARLDIDIKVADDDFSPLSPSDLVAWKPPVPSSIRPAVYDPHDLLSVFTTKQLVKLASQSYVPIRRQFDGTPIKNPLPEWLARASERLSQQITPLGRDQLLSLIHYNLSRGFLMNSIILGTASLNLCEEIKVFKKSAGQNFPPSLMPTKLQQTVVHPSWLDLFPSPRIRDNLINRIGTFDEDELCRDMVGELCEDADVSLRPRFVDEDTDGLYARERQGLILWSDPWDISGWEVTPCFLRNWGWVMEGCPELITASNRWRASRNEVPLAQALRMNLSNL